MLADEPDSVVGVDTHRTRRSRRCPVPGYATTSPTDKAIYNVIRGGSVIGRAPIVWSSPAFVDT